MLGQMTPNQQSVHIRRARVADAGAVAAVHADAWQEAYRSILPAQLLSGVTPETRLAPRRAILADPNIWCFVAEDPNGGIVGFADCGPERGASNGLGEIYAIYLLELFSGRGLGTVLMAACAAQLRMAGYIGARLWVLEQNVSARRFYESLGGQKQDAMTESRGGVQIVEVRYQWDTVALERLASRSSAAAC